MGAERRGAEVQCREQLVGRNDLYTHGEVRPRRRGRGQLLLRLWQQAGDDEYDDNNATLVSIRILSWLDGCDSYFTIFRYVSVSLKRCSC